LSKVLSYLILTFSASKPEQTQLLKYSVELNGLSSQIQTE